MYLFATVGVFLFDGLLSDLPERLYGAAKVCMRPLARRRP